ncbi:MAG: relaxase/mobilization nuclease domain-containing protein, partial [Lachnospiraceae bacterium]|nr:relaxase/mobilization nuclease domain-containing protein [Lachnospiraceae bacterium]
MAVTKIIPLHARKGTSALNSLSDRIDYIEDEKKTEQGKFISSYMCAPETAAEEFLLSRQQYVLKHTDKVKNGKEVIAYQIIQSFKPGEISPEKANELGYELAMRFTKGKHAFVVSTHTDKEHIHNHIIYNAVDLNADRKFRDFLRSGRAVQKLSDIICL